MDRRFAERFFRNLGESAREHVEQLAVKVFTFSIKQEGGLKVNNLKFVVCRSDPENRQHYFSKFHDTVEEAKKEAERLCRKERASFIVLQVIGKCYVPETPVVWEEVN